MSQSTRCLTIALWGFRRNSRYDGKTRQQMAQELRQWRSEHGPEGARWLLRNPHAR